MSDMLAINGKVYPLGGTRPVVAGRIVAGVMQDLFIDPEFMDSQIEGVRA